jgi:selenocysteine lyase/cysteine desulfurase
VIGGSTTQLFRNLSQTLQFSAGDELILSGIDHEANVASWVSLAQRQSLHIKWWIPKDRENPKLLASDLQELLSDRTRLVTCTHASNILGTIHDVKAIAEAVHTIPGAMLCVDAVAYAPHRPIDVKELEVDFYCFSWYKVYGPHVSMLYASRAAQERMHSLGHYFNSSSTLQGKVGLAASNYELTASLPAVVSYFGTSPSQVAQTWAAIRAHEEKLQEILLTYLNSRKDITVFGERSADSAIRVPTVSFVVAGRNSRDIVQAVERVSDFGFRWGSFYSNRLVEDFLGLGTEGVVRVSMVHYNTGKWPLSFSWQRGRML